MRHFSERRFRDRRDAVILLILITLVLAFWLGYVVAIKRNVVLMLLLFGGGMGELVHLLRILIMDVEDLIDLFNVLDPQWCEKHPGPIACLFAVAEEERQHAQHQSEDPAPNPADTHTIPVRHD